MDLESPQVDKKMGKKFLRTESVTLVTFPSFVESNTLAGYQGYPRVRASYPRVSETERAREKTKSADGKGIKGNIGSGFKVQAGPEREMILCHNKFPLLQY